MLGDVYCVRQKLIHTIMMVPRIMKRLRLPISPYIISTDSIMWNMYIKSLSKSLDFAKTTPRENYI